MTDTDTSPSAIRLLCLDVDGVLTDGSIILDENGIETKRFHVRDGLAMRAWRECGHEIAIISSRPGGVVEKRMSELGIVHVHCGVKDKRAVFEEVLETVGVTAQESAMVGDDLPDLRILRRCGFPVAVADAAPEVRKKATMVTNACGGQGAVREVIEHLLSSQNRWNDVVARYDV